MIRTLRACDGVARERTEPGTGAPHHIQTEDRADMEMMASEGEGSESHGGEGEISNTGRAHRKRQRHETDGADGDDEQSDGEDAGVAEESEEERRRKGKRKEREEDQVDTQHVQHLQRQRTTRRWTAGETPAAPDQKKYVVKSVMHVNNLR